MDQIFSNDDNAKAMAFFCKRVTFDDAFNRAHGGTKAERETMAYIILDAFREIETYLKNMGVLPR